MSSRNLTHAARAAIIAVPLGCFLFQVSSLAFDYMRLRQLPLYSSAASIREFADSLSGVTDEMEDRNASIRALLRDRATIDIDIADRSEAARAAIVDARNFLRTRLSLAQQQTSGFDKAAIRFTDTDAVFSHYCTPQQNIAASGLNSNPDNASESSGMVEADSAVPVQPKRKINQESVDSLSDSQKAAFAAACEIKDGYCKDNKVNEAFGVRARMVCAQTSLQSLLNRKEAITAFSYDSSSYLVDALKLKYPSIEREDVFSAIKISEAYRALTRSVPEDCAVESPSKCKAEVGKRIWLVAQTWDFALAIPLAVLYLALAFIFGGLGSLANYLYATVAPDEVVATPQQSPWFALVAGGGAAILSLLIVMAGFQFLTVGVSAPDLAYPNPLVVCGLSGLVGLRGDGVLSALKNLLGRFLTSSDSSERGNAADATADKAAADQAAADKAAADKAAADQAAADKAAADKAAADQAAGDKAAADQAAADQAAADKAAVDQAAAGKAAGDKSGAEKGAHEGGTRDSTDKPAE